tara:strand:+ start:2844 stop:4187 length:1344 start_codon:yes stop_codon:yes gene_type:complete
MARIINAFEQFLDSAGNPLSGGKVNLYESGSSTTRKTTYSDSAETIANANPVVLDGEGRCPDVWGSGTYRVIVTDANDVQIELRDPVGGNSGVFFGSDWNSTQEYDLGDVVLYNGTYWYSNEADNLNNAPSDNSVEWRRFNNFVGENLLINGDFRPKLWQRDDTFATGLGDHYTADRWNTVNNCAVSLSQNAPEGFTNSAFVEASDGAQPILRQAILLDREGGAGDLYIGQTITISGWVRATNHTHDVSLALQFRDGITDEVNNVVDLGVTNIYTVQAQNTWEYFEYTHTIGAAPNSTNLAYVFILRSETIDESSHFTGLKIEQGSIATLSYPKPIGEMLALCKWYFFKTYRDGEYAGDAVLAGSYRAYADSSGNAAINIPLTSGSRIAGDATAYSPVTGASGKISGNTSGDLDAIVSVGQSSVLVRCTTAVAGELLSVHLTLDAEI